MTVELLFFEGCPHVPPARDLVRRCLERLALEVTVVERIGDYASPTLLVNGCDVMGASSRSGPCCRLDVPTEERVVRALRDAIGGSSR